MKAYSSYLRAVVLSVFAAFVIDAVIHYEEYKESVANSFKPQKQIESEKTVSAWTPVRAVKIAPAIVDILN